MKCQWSFRIDTSICLLMVLTSTFCMSLTGTVLAAGDPPAVILPWEPPPSLSAQPSNAPRMAYENDASHTRSRARTPEEQLPSLLDWLLSSLLPEQP